MPGDVVDQRALERGQRRVEGLQGAERGDVDLDDGAVGEPAPQVEGQGFHLGQLGHAASLGRAGRRQGCSYRSRCSSFSRRYSGSAAPGPGGLEDRGGGRLLLVHLFARAAIRPSPITLGPTAGRGAYGAMATARPLPETGSIFLDARGGDRALRVSWHHESGPGRALAVARQRLRRLLPARRRRGARADRHAARRPRPRRTTSPPRTGRRGPRRRPALIRPGSPTGA